MSMPSRVLAGALLVFSVACSSDSTGPVAGNLTVSLKTPNPGQDEAVLLVLTAPTPPGSEQAAGALLLWKPATPGTADTLAVTGTLSAGALLTLSVDDVNQASHYHARLIQVAASGSHVLRGMTGYSAVVGK